VRDHWRTLPLRNTLVGCIALPYLQEKYLTAGTVMQSSHMPLSTWFWGAYLMTTQTPGQSAVQFQRQLGIATYETAFTMLHKLRAGMVRPDRDAIGTPHPVEVDECCIGGRTRGEGRGIHHQTTVVGAVEVRTRKDAEDRSAKWKDTHEGGIPAKNSLMRAASGSALYLALNRQIFLFLAATPTRSQHLSKTM
jgi:hypothetical protein